MQFNSDLLNTIESEIIQNKDLAFEKIIPINHYSFETKKTLDYLVEKYGGIINRYDDKIIIFINNPNKLNKKTTLEEDQLFSNKFERINSSINNLNERLTTVEEKVDYLMEEKNRDINIQNKNLQSYLNYFRNHDEVRHLKKLAEEIINHH